MEQKFLRDIFFFKRYFLDFFAGLDERVKRKLDWTLELIATTERIPSKYFKHIEDTAGLYEIRVEAGGNIFRVFAFFDEGQLIIVANGFQKKTQKTPKNEIAFAKKIQKEYFDEKDKG